ncbi:hypothetical protein A1Q2_01535 [Trichosporon asahii var. asahii CBS 8904]|uniref:Uncharacterized protein n=2 Tax=Trichosporon asahii var. asahii TaxID=189963 RepID=K1WTI5_TRIAC|nr:hypothetical protein A1Q1_05167 [Trichosporon asahii var. asahii CBS 2479]EJT46210.1 hypothetical protein A1Q1_05167 [Trichosporon asahii var. asahii CBS 2479]EKD04189.1 hypothetical protein A1Q2_01535 [Trichosporon asahii var. asahii CBS 8904]
MTQERRPQFLQSFSCPTSPPDGNSHTRHDPRQPFKPPPSRAHVPLPSVAQVLQTLPALSTQDYKEYKRLQRVQIFPIYSARSGFQVQLPRSPLERARLSKSVKLQNGGNGYNRAIRWEEKGRKLRPLDWSLTQQGEEKWSGDWSMLKDRGMKRCEERGRSSSPDTE